MISNSYLLSGVHPSLKVLGGYWLGCILTVLLCPGHPELAPSQFVEVGMDVKYCEENMFMACIKFIKEV